jgi:thiol-disulfide isomerase/thioredoxin
MNIKTIIISLVVFCIHNRDCFAQAFGGIDDYSLSKLSAIEPGVHSLNDSTKIKIVTNHRAITSLTQVTETFPGKHLFIDLWATWCMPCLANMPTSDSLANELTEEGIQLVYISLDTDSNDVQWKKMIAERKLYGAHIRATKALQDAITMVIWNGIDVYSIPHYLIISKDGKVWNKNAPAPKERERFNEALADLHQQRTVH